MTRCHAIFLLLFVALTTSAVIAAPEATPSPPPAAVISSDNPQAFDPAAATKAWLDTVSAEKRAKSDAYFEGGYWLLLWDFVVGAAISIFLLQSRISARLRDWAERVTRIKSLQVVFFAVSYVIIVAVLSFPLTIYELFYREHYYGLATQSFGPWFGDQLKSLIVGLIAACVAFPIVYAVFRRASRSWWIWGAIVAICLSIVSNVIAPVFIFPLFNKYTPLEDPKIRDPILTMARANRIPVDQVFVVDASRQTTRVSANVAGLFGTTRIALNDNLLNRCSLNEIREVMGHEMGHFVLNHGNKLTIYLGICCVVAFALMKLGFNIAVRKWGQRWGIRDASDPAGLPLLVLLFGTIMFLGTPITNTIVRVTEREADVFGLNLAREPDAGATIALKLGEYRKLDPGPLEEFIFYDHPSGRARIRMAMDWKAAQLGCGEIK